MRLAHVVETFEHPKHALDRSSRAIAPTSGGGGDGNTTKDKDETGFLPVLDALKASIGSWSEPQSIAALHGAFNHLEESRLTSEWARRRRLDPEAIKRVVEGEHGEAIASVIADLIFEVPVIGGWVHFCFGTDVEQAHRNMERAVSDRAEAPRRDASPSPLTVALGRALVWNSRALPEASTFVRPLGLMREIVAPLRIAIDGAGGGDDDDGVSREAPSADAADGNDRFYNGLQDKLREDCQYKAAEAELTVRARWTSDASKRAMDDAVRAPAPCCYFMTVTRRLL